MLMAKRKHEEQEFLTKRKKLEKDNMVIIVYCGSCGFEPRAEHLEKLLTEKVHVKVGKIQEIKTTGNFDVYVRDQQDTTKFNLVHSKKQKNHGFVDGMEKFERILHALTIEDLPAASVVPSANGGDKKKPPSPETDDKEEPIDVDEVIAKNALVIFSKTYCGYCKKAKKALIEHGFDKQMVIELDNRSDGDQIQQLLKSKTGITTVPSIWMKGKFIGGSDMLLSALKTGEISLRNMPM
jgi:glutaredoxin 3